MTFLAFDPRVQSYLPADRLLGAVGIKQTDATKASRRLADEHEDHLLTQDQRSQMELHEAYRQDAGLPPERHLAINASQIMTAPVVVLRTNQTLIEARNLFRDRRFRHVPVLSAEERLVGIVSERDVLHHAADPAGTQVGQLMTQNVLVASPDTEIRDIAAVLFERRIGAMPIMAEDEALVGIITRSDILRTLVNRAPLELWV